ncbi:MAG: pyrroloquinoline quinone biosynthesis peptide chaperone PqqD [Limisphaerales bacterium]
MTAIANDSRPRLADKARLKWDAVRQQHLLLFPEGLLILNKTANEVLGLCDGQRDVSAIVKILGEKYQNNGVERDVKQILERLAGKNLVRLNG